MSNYFTELNGINVNDKTDNKGDLTYLSWAWAWGELKKKHPDAVYTVYENDKGWNYHTDGRYAWVKTGVTVNGIEHIEYLPVMDYKNKSIPADRITAFDVNKTIQRSLTKAIARHGLGLYIYAGEDLPDENDGLANDRPSVTAEQTKKNISEEQQANANMQKKVTKREAVTLDGMIRSAKVDINEVLAHFNVKSLEEMTKEQYAQCIKMLPNGAK